MARLRRPRLDRVNVCFIFAIGLVVGAGCAHSAPLGTPPNNGRILAEGHVPQQCTEADAPFNSTGATYGYYWSENSKQWISAPYCYARWGLMEASASQVIAAGDTVTVSAKWDDGSMAGHIAVQGGMNWSYPGTLVSGCGSKDISCTVKIGDEDAPPTEWAWHQFHIGAPGRVFILPPSYAPRCQADMPCLDTATNAWAYVGVSPGDPCSAGNPAPGTAAAVACKALGLTWSVPKNLQYQSWSTTDGVIPPNLVKRKTFTLNLKLKNGNDPYTSCPSGKFYKWKVKTPPGLKKAHIAGEGCDPSLSASEEGVYKVSVDEYSTKTNKKTGRSVQNADVVVQDWLVVGMGDSNGSGQGTDLSADAYAYEFKQCDRGNRSYQYKIAQLLEEADEKTSVTFIHTACSGARTVHLTHKKYVGQEVNFTNPLPPQIRQLQKRIKTADGFLEVDALILSIGINDSLFGGIIGNCLTTLAPNVNCHTRSYQLYNNPDTGGEPDLKLTSLGTPGSDTMESLVAKAMSDLPALYKPVGTSLKALNILPKRVFITSYPDAMTDDNGEICKGSFIGLTDADWQWLSTVGSVLRGYVMQTAAQRKWTPIGSIGDPFQKHGYCAQGTWFNSPFSSGLNQGNIYGTFHANETGHQKMADEVFPYLCQQMYGNNDCKNAMPRKPRK